MVPGPHPHRNATHAVASEAAAAKPAVSWFENVQYYREPNGSVPAVPKDSPAREMVWNVKSVDFTLWPLDLGSDYEVALTFLSDTPRTVDVMAGGINIASKLALPSGSVFSQRFSIPTAALKRIQGANPAWGVAMSVVQVTGPNAILSNFTLYSSNATDPFLPPQALPQPPKPVYALPRLTSRPTRVVLPPGPSATVGDSVMTLESPLVLLHGTWNFAVVPLGSDSALDAALKDGITVAWSPIQVPGEYALQVRIGPRGALGGRWHLRSLSALTLAPRRFRASLSILGSRACTSAPSPSRLPGGRPWAPTFG